MVDRYLRLLGYVVPQMRLEIKEWCGCLLLLIQA